MIDTRPVYSNMNVMMIMYHFFICSTTSYIHGFALLCVSQIRQDSHQDCQLHKWLDNVPHIA